MPAMPAMPDAEDGDAGKCGPSPLPWSLRARDAVDEGARRDSSAVRGAPFAYGALDWWVSELDPAQQHARSCSYRTLLEEARDLARMALEPEGRARLRRGERPYGWASFREAAGGGAAEGNAEEGDTHLMGVAASKRAAVYATVRLRELREGAVPVADVLVTFETRGAFAVPFVHGDMTPDALGWRLTGGEPKCAEPKCGEVARFAGGGAYCHVQLVDHVEALAREIFCFGAL